MARIKAHRTARRTLSALRRATSGKRPALRAAATAAAAAVAITGLTVTLAGTALASTQAAEAGQAAAANRSGLPWASGVYLPNATPATVSAFGA